MRGGERWEESYLLALDLHPPHRQRPLTSLLIRKCNEPKPFTPRALPIKHDLRIEHLAVRAEKLPQDLDGGRRMEAADEDFGGLAVLVVRDRALGVDLDRPRKGEKKKEKETSTKKSAFSLDNQTPPKGFKSPQIRRKGEREKRTGFPSTTCSSPRTLSTLSPCSKVRNANPLDRPVGSRMIVHASTGPNFSK